MFQYEIPRVQHLQQLDRAQRVAFSHSGMVNILSDYGFLRPIVFDDECVFHVSKFANTQNMPTSGQENPRETRQHELDSKCVTVWCGIHANGVISRYYSNKKSVRGFNYYQFLGTQAHSKAQKFSQIFVLEQGAVPLYITGIVHFFPLK